jgi:hypothetical protein
LSHHLRCFAPREPEACPMSNSCKPWDDQQVERLKTLVASGASPFKAAAALKRAQTSVQVKARKLGTPFITNRVAKRLRNSKMAMAERESQNRNPA